MRRPTIKCAANRVRCPDPTCRHVQPSARTPHGKVRGRGIDACVRCGLEYFYHAADGGVEVVGLWPGEAERLDVDQPLPRIWERLGLMAAEHIQAVA
jgi:hypothetical protein